MFELFSNVKFDWIGKRRIFIAISIFVMLTGLVSTTVREIAPGGTNAFNLGVDFKGGTVIKAQFRQLPSDGELRAALNKAGAIDPVIQASKGNVVLIKIPSLEGNSTENPATNSSNTASNTNQAANNTNANVGNTATQTPTEPEKNQVNAGRAMVKTALDTFGKESDAILHLAGDQNAAYEIIGTDSVGPVAGADLRIKAVTATLLGLLGILFFIAFRYDWTYAAGAVIAVFHDVLMVLAFFSVFQWEVGLTVIAALLTIVGFSVNDSIVIFDRVRENLATNRTDSLYKITNASINQTLSRTIITSGLVLLSVIALVFFGGEVLRSFSLALLVGITMGTYSTVAIASPIAIWWQGKLGESKMKTPDDTPKAEKLASASRRPVTRRSVAR